MTQIHSRTANGIEPCTVNTALPYFPLVLMREPSL